MKSRIKGIKPTSGQNQSTHVDSYIKTEQYIKAICSRLKIHIDTRYEFCSIRTKTVRIHEAM